jgi:hypothetical protein
VANCVCKRKSWSKLLAWHLFSATAGALNRSWPWRECPHRKTEALKARFTGKNFDKCTESLALGVLKLNSRFPDWWEGQQCRPAHWIEENQERKETKRTKGF